jgi:hypothetical protein
MNRIANFVELESGSSIQGQVNPRIKHGGEAASYDPGMLFWTKVPRTGIDHWLIYLQTIDTVPNNSIDLNPDPIGHLDLVQTVHSFLTLTWSPATPFELSYSDVTTTVTTATSSTTVPASRQFVNAEALFESLAAEYLAGKTDIPQIVQRLGAPWSEADAVLRLERSGIHRPIGLSAPSPDQKIRVLNRLARIRAEFTADEFNEQHSIEREVTASQRIESVYVQPEDFTR